MRGVLTLRPIKAQLWFLIFWKQIFFNPIRWALSNCMMVYEWQRSAVYLVQHYFSIFGMFQRSVTRVPGNTTYQVLFFYFRLGLWLLHRGGSREESSPNRHYGWGRVTLCTIRTYHTYCSGCTDMKYQWGVWLYFHLSYTLDPSFSM